MLECVVVNKIHSLKKKKKKKKNLSNDSFCYLLSLVHKFIQQGYGLPVDEYIFILNSLTS
jgi:hypothetical protein